jgi:hypothetical protein
MPQRNPGVVAKWREFMWLRKAPPLQEYQTLSGQPFGRKLPDTVIQHGSLTTWFTRSIRS